MPAILCLECSARSWSWKTVLALLQQATQPLQLCPVTCTQLPLLLQCHFDLALMEHAPPIGSVDASQYVLQPERHADHRTVPTPIRLRLPGLIVVRSQPPGPDAILQKDPRRVNRQI